MTQFIPSAQQHKHIPAKQAIQPVDPPPESFWGACCLGRDSYQCSSHGHSPTQTANVHINSLGSWLRRVTLLWVTPSWGTLVITSLLVALSRWLKIENISQVAAFLTIKSEYAPEDNNHLVRQEVDLTKMVRVR